jgi:hypothetical protein
MLLEDDSDQLADRARFLGYYQRDRLIDRLQLMLNRNEAYLLRRSQRGTYTSHDETTAEDMGSRHF